MAVASVAGFGSFAGRVGLRAQRCSGSCYLHDVRAISVDAGRLRLVVTLVFGLIHGFGFAADLLRCRLPTERLVELLVGFNLGVEVGQLTLVFSLLGIVAVLAKARNHAAAPDRRGRAVLAGSSRLGMYWFISRSLFKRNWRQESRQGRQFIATSPRGSTGLADRPAGA